MIGGSDNGWHQQKCDRREPRWIIPPRQLVDQKVDLLCRPGTRWYRLISEVSWPSFAHEDVPIVGDQHFEKHASHRFKINCNEAGAWRFHARHKMDFIEVGEARRISPGATLGNELRTSVGQGDSPDSGLPERGNGGWDAHHLISGGDRRGASE